MTVAVNTDDVYKESQRVTGYAAAMLALCVFIGATEGYDVQAMALAAPLVRAAWHIGFNEIGLLLSVSAIGLVFGSFLLSPLGDALGRRPAILLGLLVAAGGTGGGAFADGLGTLLVTRFIAGLGLGLALPNVLAMSMELMPRRLHTFAVVVVSCGYPLGAALGAAAASALVPTHGAAAVFLVGGGATLTALLLAAAVLPESPSFLAQRPNRIAELDRILAQLGRTMPPATVRDSVQRIDGVGARLSAVFAPGRRRMTALLWLMNLGNIALVYFFFSWLPSLIAAGGLDAEVALRATSLFSASGAAGALAMAYLLPLLGALRVLAGAYLIAIVATIALASVAGVDQVFLVTLAVAGAAIVGSQFCLSAVVAQAYPAAVRATASGFASGIGRAGAVVTPIAAGALIGMIGGSRHAFLIALLPASIALVSCLLLLRSGDLRDERN